MTYEVKVSETEGRWGSARRVRFVLMSNDEISIEIIPNDEHGSPWIAVVPTAELAQALNDLDGFEVKYTPKREVVEVPTGTRITHDTNGPFVRASWEATPEGQTEKVYAIEVVRESGKIEHWNARAEPYDDDAMLDQRERAYRLAFSPGDRIIEVRQVSKEVTISSTPWEGVQV